VEDPWQTTEKVIDLQERSASAVDAAWTDSALFIDNTSRSVVEETYSLIDQTSRRVAEDTRSTTEAWMHLQERSATVVDAAISDPVSFIDNTSKSVVEETYSLLDQTSRKVKEETRQTTEALMNFHERASTVAEAAKTETAKTIELKRNEVLQAFDAFREESAGIQNDVLGMQNWAQAHAHEFGGTVQEQANAIGANFFQWDEHAERESIEQRSSQLAPLSDELGEKALKLGEKAQENINALGGLLGGLWTEPARKDKNRERKAAGWALK